MEIENRRAPKNIIDTRLVLNLHSWRPLIFKQLTIKQKLKVLQL